MPAASPTSPSARDVVVAVSLTLAAGFVDAFGFLTLSGVYTANMSGNTVLIGVHALTDRANALLHAFTIAMFIVGLVTSGVIIEAGLRRRIRRSFALAMTAEAVFLLLFMALGSELLPVSGDDDGELPLYLLIALAAVAMGLQNTSLRMAGVLTVCTTHVSGTITRFSEFMVGWLFARRDRAKGFKEAAVRIAEERRGALMSAGLWTAFFAGAALASYLHPKWQAPALLLPLAIVVAVGVADAVAPLTDDRGLMRARHDLGQVQRPASGTVLDLLPAGEAARHHAAELVAYEVVGGRSIPVSLTGKPGNPARGKVIAADRKLGNCLACHVLPVLVDLPFHGDVGPSLAGVANRLKEGELRLWVVDPKVVNPDTIMPAFYRTEGLYRVMEEFEGKPILTAEQVEDVVALLMTLSGEQTAPGAIRPADEAPEVVKVEPPAQSNLSELISGYYFGIEETRAMQDDDLANPAMVWVDLGADLWEQVEGAAEKACASCHGEAEDSMAGVGASYPKYNEGAGKVLNLEQQINRCRSERMETVPWPFGSDELLAMTIFVKHQSRGMPVNVAIDGPAAPFFEKGKAFFHQRRGLLDMSCAHCHDRNYDKMLRGDWLSQGHTNAYPIYALGDANARPLHKLLWHCNELMRSTPFDVLSDEFVNLELFLAWRGSGLPVETPGVRW